ncbi:sensor histidine kinase [Devosia sp.]|uniref:sensor histidine kinase n=1 Tax=Devosia sp. TaxID=1871048 RepID=UPI002F15E117
MTDATSDLGLATAVRKQSGRLLAIVISLALIVGAAGSALFLVRGVDSQLSDVVKTFEVRRQARELILALVDAETGQRGYLLTLDPQYLGPYRDAVATIDRAYQDLVTMVADTPAQKLLLGLIADQVKQKQVEMANTIALASSGRLPEAMEILRSDTGQTLMEGLRAAIRRFILEEDGRLVERNAEVERTRQLLVVAILAALAGAVTLTYALFTRTQHQVSELARNRTTLLLQKEELEEHVRERTAEAEEARAHAERERARVETLLQDTNHRIGNSLATVSSLLGLQQSRTTSPAVRSALEAAQSRVQAIASAHRRLRLGDDLETTDAAEFLESVVDDLRQTQPSERQISVETDFDPLVISARDATTLGIVMGELLTNAMKHAFPDDRPGRIWARLKQEGESVRLIVEDDGCGLPPEIDRAEGGLGSMIIRQLARQFGGEPSFAARPGGGATVTVALPALGRQALRE